MKQNLGLLISGIGIAVLNTLMAIIAFIFIISFAVSDGGMHNMMDGYNYDYDDGYEYDMDNFEDFNNTNENLLPNIGADSFIFV